jgi:hypothetical protein
MLHIRISQGKLDELTKARNQAHSTRPVRRVMRNLIKGADNGMVVPITEDDTALLSIDKVLVETYKTYNLKDLSLGAGSRLGAGLGDTESEPRRAPSGPQPLEAQVKAYLKREMNLSNVPYFENHLEGRFRPDMRFDLGAFNLILEVDENQHKSYDQLDEYLRMLAIKDTLKRPCVFIRFNPVSKYTTGNLPLCKEQRLTILKDALESIMKLHLTDDFCYAFYMFYDGHDNDQALM